MTAKRGRWRLAEPPPPRATPLPVETGIRRIVAPNPSAMTYHGTNSWLVDWREGTVLIDPGTEDEVHLEALVAEAGDRLTHILLTHTHSDHLGGARTLAAHLGVPVAAYHTSADAQFEADLKLQDGDRIGGLTVLYTPGHAMDHVCFVHESGVIFSGDHVMGWSTSVVPPAPYGDLRQFIASMERVRDRNDRLMLSAHGPAITQPFETVQGLLDHRMARERSIVALLADKPCPIEALLARAYFNLKPELRGPARANLLSHLIKLEQDGRASRDEAGWRALI